MATKAQIEEDKIILQVIVNGELKKQNVES